MTGFAKVVVFSFFYIEFFKAQNTVKAICQQKPTTQCDKTQICKCMRSNNFPDAGLMQKIPAKNPKFCFPYFSVSFQRNGIKQIT